MQREFGYIDFFCKYESDVEASMQQNSYLYATFCKHLRTSLKL